MLAGALSVISVSLLSVAVSSTDVTELSYTDVVPLKQSSSLAEPRECLAYSDVVAVQPLNAEAWLFTLESGDRFVSQVTGYCEPALSPRNQIVFDAYDRANICEGERAGIMARYNRERAGRNQCQLGAFHPVELRQ